MRILLVVAMVGALPGCASSPVVVATSMPPGILKEAQKFAVVTPDSVMGRAAVPAVVDRLERFGFRQSDDPDLLVVVSFTDRARPVGAYTIDTCGSVAWAAEPRRKWFIGGGRIVALQIQIAEARSGRMLYRSSITKRTSSGGGARNFAGLAAAALANDPRLAPPLPEDCS